MKDSNSKATDDLPKEFRQSRNILTERMSGLRQDTTAQLSMKEKQRREASRYADELKNPCLRENESSMKCMNDSSYDRDQCTLYFVNYRNCLNFWGRIRRDRRSKGIKPDLPPPEERDKVKQEYWSKLG